MAEENKMSYGPSADQEKQEAVRKANEELMTLYGALRALQKDDLRQWSAGFDEVFVKCRDEEVADDFIKFLKNHALELHLSHCKEWKKGFRDTARNANPYTYWGGRTTYRMKGEWPNWDCVGTVHTLFFDLDKLEMKEDQRFCFTDFEAKYKAAFTSIDWMDFD